MAYLGQTFVASQLPKENNYGAVPAGEYVATIASAELKATKAGDGQYINTRYKIVDGEFKGRSFFDLINISNPNPQSVEIGLARLNTIIECGGLHEIQDSDQLVGIIIKAILTVEQYNGSDKNRLLRIENLNSVPQQQAQQPLMQQPVQPQQPVYQQPAQLPSQLSHWGQQPVQQPTQQPVYQQPVQQQQPVAPQQQVWGQQPIAPQQPTIQNTQNNLEDEIPF